MKMVENALLEIWALPPVKRTAVQFTRVVHRGDHFGSVIRNTSKGAHLDFEQNIKCLRSATKRPRCYTLGPPFLFFSPAQFRKVRSQFAK